MSKETTNKPGLRITIEARYDLAYDETIEFISQTMEHAIETIVGDGFLTAHHNLDSDVEEYSASIVPLPEGIHTEYKTLQQLALGNAIAHFLSGWPDGMTNEDILEKLSEDEDGELGDITPWEPFEAYEGQTLLHHIEDLASTYLQAFRLARDASLVDTGESI